MPRLQTPQRFAPDAKYAPPELGKFIEPSGVLHEKQNLVISFKGRAKRGADRRSRCVFALNDTPFGFLW